MHLKYYNEAGASINQLRLSLTFINYEWNTEASLQTKLNKFLPLITQFELPAIQS